MNPRERKLISISVISAMIFGGGGGLAIFFLDPWGKPLNYTPNSFDISGFSVNDFTYILQYDGFNSRESAISALRSTDYDLIIMELYYSGDVWMPEEIEEIANKNGTNPKKLLCYMSIGEAENYRPYWQDDWDSNGDGVPDDGAPDWLDIENPDWEGNYKVRYWMPEWQELIFGSNESYLDLILARNFDGVYLDIVDAFEYYEEQGDEGAGQKMVDFIGNLSAYAKNINPNFLIVPQNGESLVEYDGYLDTVDGIGREDVLYTGNWRNSREEIDWVFPYLKEFLDAGKFVFEVEYCSIPRYINRVYGYAKESGFICYIGPRDLSKIRINKGYEPD